MAEKKTWADLTETEKRAIYVSGAVEVVITTVALIDLAKRPGERVRGPKWAWLLSFVIQPFGPLSYLFLGRVRD